MAVNFAKALGREVKHTSRRFGFAESKAFFLWFAMQILEIEEDAAVEAVSVEGSNDKGIDLFYVDDEEGRVLIGQGKYSADLSYRAKEMDISTLQSSLDWLASPEALAREGKPELAQAARDYLEAQKEGYGVELLYVYAGPKSANAEKKIAVYNQNQDNASRRRYLRHYHAQLLADLWQEVQGERRRIDNETIRIQGNSHLIEGRFGKALVTSVPGAELVRLYRVHEDRLFDRNVRLFLGARKGSVNAGMAATIRDGGARPNFWAYNNGITLICDDFQEADGRLQLTNFSIVNGCQTTVSLAENGGDSPEILVLLRCVAAGSEILDEVIRYTNSQNPIRTWDIASQYKTQRRLKTDFSNLQKPFIYLTRRGDRPTGDPRRFREDGRKRLIKIDVAGQYMAAFRGDPVLAYKHKALVFSRHHEDVFPPDVRAEEVLFCWTCGQVCQSVVRELMKKDPDEARILKKGGTLFTLAVLAELAKKRNGATYLARVSQHQVASEGAVGRLKKYGELAARLYVRAVQDEAALQEEELPTLIRQKEFWLKVVKRALGNYETLAINPDWVKGALPKLG